MRDLNLGPDTRKLIERYNRIDRAQTPDHEHLVFVAADMMRMLERWIEVGWCWVCANPATICHGPHVKVRYDFDRTVDVIEPINKVGTTFAEAPYHVITD